VGTRQAAGAGTRKRVARHDAAIDRRPVGLTTDDVVTAAVDLLDEVGAGSFSIRELGRRLQVSAPTIYWHVGSKDGLLLAVADRVLAGLDEDIDDSGDWEARLRQQLDAARRVFTTHANVLDVAATQYPEALSRWARRVLQLMLDAGFDDSDAGLYANLLLQHSLGTSVMEVKTRLSATVEPAEGDRQSATYRLRTDLAPEDVTPAIARMIVFNLDEQHEVMTDLMIVGLKTALRERRKARRRKG
jgi:AcrR family transcriptional regulator